MHVHVHVNIQCSNLHVHVHVHVQLHVHVNLLMFTVDIVFCACGEFTDRLIAVSQYLYLSALNFEVYTCIEFSICILY